MNNACFCRPLPRQGPQLTITHPANNAVLAYLDDIQGTSMPCSLICITIDRALHYTATSDAQGAWRVPLNVDLRSGAHTIAATSGCSAAVASVTIEETPCPCPGPDALSVTLAEARTGRRFRTIDLTVTVESPEYPVTLYYLALPPGSPPPRADEVIHYSNTALLERGEAAKGQLAIDAPGGHILPITGHDGEAVPGQYPGIVDGHYYDVYVVAQTSAEQTPVLTTGATAMGMPFDGGEGSSILPFAIRQLREDELALYPDLLAANNETGVDDYLRMLRNIGRMQHLYADSGGHYGLRRSMALDYMVTSPLDVSLYSTAYDGHGWLPIGYRAFDGLIPSPFTGSFAGAGDATKITGMHISVARAPLFLGLFALGIDAAFRDIAIGESVVSVTFSDNYAIAPAAAAGTLIGGAILTSFASIAISGADIQIASDPEVEPLCIAGGLTGGMALNRRVDGITLENVNISAPNEGAQIMAGGLTGIIFNLPDLEISATVNSMNSLGRYLTALTGPAARSASDEVYSTSVYFAALQEARASVLAKLGKGAEGEPARSYQRAFANDAAIVLVGALAGNRQSITEGDLLGDVDSTIINIAVNGLTARGAIVIGGISGYVMNLTQVENISITNMVTNVSSAGGIFGDASFEASVRSDGPDAGTAYIRNCTVSSSTLNNKYSDVSAFLAHGNAYVPVHIENIAVSNVTLTGSSHIGGLFGSIQAYSDGNYFVSDSSFSGTIFALNEDTYITGGFVGNVNKGVFTNCHVSGTIMGASVNTGGFVGTAYGVQSSANLAPADLTLRFVQCSVNGSVVASQNDGYLCGGFAGSGQASFFSQCYVTGSVHQGGSVSGGFAGELSYFSHVENCYSAAQVTTIGSTAGGMAANDASYSTGSFTMEYCYYSGALSADTMAGGLIGQIHWNQTGASHLFMLGQSVSAGSEPAHLIAGDAANGASLSSNYALTDSQIIVNGTPVTGRDPTLDGTQISSALLKITMQTQWASVASLWNFDTIDTIGRPTLLSNPETIPV